MKESGKPSNLKTVFANRKAKEVEKLKENDTTPFVERFTQKKLDEWKELSGGRKLIYLKHENDLAVLRPPTADDLGDYMEAIGTNGLSKAVAMVTEQLWLDGDIILIEDEEKFISVFLQINNILEGKKAEFFRA
ncbi:hypothetical protein [Flavobacterium hydrophilum]|uniref:Uncharacterized protein n=1 Tax=Flavobacterium hydrophilum TaxID=2211445 RepID=A0A2V4C047_9FLAO|nr:hypothetical protein [Flavobacterium hydrophilum]PXY44525.1 hypothetical protein DMB68_13740 [Flavobacterium hydrophilum]